MRVPDEIRKTVLFIGLKNDLDEWEWRATGYLIGLTSHQLHWSETVEHNGQKFELSTTHPFRLLATARHVARNLEGKKFALKTMTVDGHPRIIEVDAGQRWFYHPTEEKYIDAAVTIFYPPALQELDLFTVFADWFADQKAIREANLGVGDEVFIAGLFTKVSDTNLQHPIVRIGNLAMMPGEQIWFKDRPIDAYLIESRSIGGLSGSPVFVRETIRQQIGVKFRPGKNPLNTLDRSPGESFDPVIADSLGRIYFLGSIIGHWDTPSAFDPVMKEAVNMGISPVVPAHKILEIIRQPELIEMADKIVSEQKKRADEGAALDFYEPEDEQFTREDFESALRKTSRRVSPSKSDSETK